MKTSWRDGLVNAFPVPVDRKPKALKATTKAKDAAIEADLKETETELAALTIEDPFPFFELPPELRNRIYRLVLLSKPSYRGADGRRKGSHLAILQASKRFHAETSYILYTSQLFRIFPLQDFQALPLLQEIPQHYHSLLTNLEMVVGPSWTSPPKSWRVNKSLGRCLGKLKSVQTLKIFVELDPSLPIFAKFRISFEFYTNFCGNLLKDVLTAMPQLRFVELDGNPGVDVNGPLVSRLREEVDKARKDVRWSKHNGWAQKMKRCGKLDSSHS